MALRHAQDYDSAKTWLDGGRKKWDRPLYWGNLRLQQRKTHISVHLPWAGADLMLLYPDGTKVIQAPVTTLFWGGTFPTIKSQGVRYKLSVLANFNYIYQRNYECRIVERDPSLTPAKIQGCRSCKSSGMMDAWCSPDTCWRIENGKCTEHIGAVAHTSYATWHPVPCEHGKLGHTIYRVQTCYNCKGTGKRDYGSKAVFTLWDGSPIRVKDGKIVKREPTELEKRIAAYVRPID